MAIRKKRGGAKAKSGAAGRKKARTRKQKASRKKKTSRKKTAARKQTAARKKGVRKQGATAKRRAGASSPGSRGPHPAAIASLFPERIGTVLHYYAQAGGAVVQLERGQLRLGDAIHIRGHTTDFYERIEELKLDDRGVELARSGQIVGIRVSRTVREKDGVFLLSQ
jgi:hypothetical protein